VDLTVSAPADPGAASYALYTSCGGQAGGPYTEAELSAIELQHGDCEPPIDFLVVSRDANQKPLKFLHVPAVTPVANKVMLAGSYQAVSARTVSATQIPSAEVDLSYFLTTPLGELFEAATYALPVTAGAASVDLAVPTLALGAMGVADYNNEITRHVVQSRTDGPSIDLAFGEPLPGWSAAPSCDFPNGSCAWTPTTSSITPDFVFLMSTHQRGEGTAAPRWFHYLIAPYESGRVALPRLPVDGFDFNPQPTDGGGLAELFLVKLETGGYDRIREGAFEHLRPLEALQPASGETTRYVELQP